MDAKQQGSELRVVALEEARGIMNGKEIKEDSQSPEKEKLTAEEPTRNLKPGESRMPEGNGAVLAEHLGTQAATFFNSSFGVELILEENSLEQNVNAKVVVKPEIRFVKCSRERDMSR